MMPLIEQALSMGYGEEQLLSFLSNMYPKFKKGIKDAKSIGYQANEILKFLSGTVKKPKNMEELLQPGQRYLKESGILTKQERAEKTRKGLSTALGVGAGILGAAGLARYAFPGEKVVEAVFDGMEPKQITGQEQKQIPFQQGQIPPTRQIGMDLPSGPSMQMGLGGFNPQEQAPPQKQSFADKILEGIDVESLPESRQKEIGFLSMIAKKLEDQGVSPSDPKMQSIMRKLRQRAKGKLTLGEQEEQRFKEAYPEQKKGGSYLEKLYSRIFDALKAGKDTTSEGYKDPLIAKAKPYFDKGLIKLPEDLSFLVTNQKTKNEVITPEGDIATVLDQPGKTSKIDIDGKQKVIESDKLIEVPENKDEILDLYERLIQAIPESERSAVINWAGYDPERKKFTVRFHSGDAYTYEDIPDEFSKRIEEAGFLAKTTGGNMFGQWAEGEASRGAGLHKLIVDLQKHYGGKGKEYSAKMKTVYSYLGEAERRLKEKQQREKEARKKKRKEQP